VLPCSCPRRQQPLCRMHLPEHGLLTVKSVRDGWVICTWLTDYGELQSGGFPIAMVEGPVTPPPDDANAETNGLSQE
jgi:hypothetical protein